MGLLGRRGPGREPARHRRGDQTCVQDLRTIGESLADAGATRLAYGELQGLIWQAQAFGFHLVELEVRQHSEAHREALAELRTGVQPSPRTIELLETFRAVRDIQDA